MKTQYQYWLHYSSLDFSTFILKASTEFSETQISKMYQRDFYGPFKTIKEAREDGLSRVNGDIKEFKGMKYQLQKNKIGELG
jgi:hypothetical protein